MNLIECCNRTQFTAICSAKRILLAMIAIVSLANSVQATEVITVTAQKLGCAGCVSLDEFMDGWYNYMEEDEQDDDLVEEWQDQREGEWLLKCEADVKQKVANCKEGVTSGGYWMGGSFCVSTTAVAVFFTTPLVGSVYGFTCGGVSNELVTNAVKSCEIGGINLKAERCQI